MAEGIMERAVLEALAAAGLPTALVDGTAPFRVRWANAAFARSLRLGAAADPLLELLGGNNEGLATILRGLRDEGPLSVVVGSRSRTRRRERELSLLPVPGPDREPAVLVLAHDVTEREETRRRLEAENLRLALFASVARRVASIDPTRVVEAAVGAACTIANGPTAIYLVGHEGEITRTATAGTSATIAGLLPRTVRPGRLKLLRRALELGCRQSLPYAPGVPADERTLLGEAAARWLVATPIRGRHGVLGALLTLWRQRRPGEALPLIDLIADQVGMALEHARQYRAAEDERARLELILGQIPDAVLIADAHGRLERTNAAGRRLLGLAPDDPLPSLDAFPATVTWRQPDGRPTPRNESELARALRGEPTAGVLVSFRPTNSSEERWFHSAAAPLRDQEGAIAGMVGVLTDITEVRKVQERLQLLVDASAALASSLDCTDALEEVARLAVRSFADWCAIDLVDGERLRRLPVAHGDPAKAPLARDLESLQPDAALTPAAQAPAIHDDVHDAPLVAAVTRADNPALLDALDLRSCMTAPMAIWGRRLGVMHFASARPGRRYDRADLAVAETLAWRVALAVDRARLYEEAREANRRKDEFLAVVSHELRTPLAPLLTWAEILRRRPDAAHARQAADVIERNIRILRGLISELLDLASITGGKMRLERAPHDLSDIVREAAEDLAPQAIEKGISLELRRATEPLPVEVDRLRLVQVVTNLVFNAVKFTPPGGGITVTTGRASNQACLGVRDTGAGIAPDFLPHVFEMFRQGEEGARRVQGGLGIGLALARQITDLHGGDIEARSEGAGRGAEFIVRLPLREPEVAVQDLRLPLDVSPAVLEDTRVLLVEDVADSREAMREMLEQFGARVVPANDGRDALQKLDGAAADLVVCDLRMPTMDGFEFVRRLRADPKRAELPVVAVSGFGSEESRSACREAGFDAYLAKPVDSSALVASIRNALRARRQAS